MVNEWNNGDTLCIVPFGGTRPTHGDYVVGALLYDMNPSPARGWYYCSNNTYPLTWTKLPNLWNLPKDPTRDGKWGQYLANGMTISGEGMMADVVGLGGSFTPNGIDGSGSSQAFGTGNTHQNAGIAILRPVGSFAGLTRLANLPCYAIRNTPTARSGADTKFYSGWITTTTPFVVGETPINQADGGIVVGYNSTDTNFNIWHGDGTNTITKVEITSPAVVPAPTSTTNLLIEMIALGSTNIWINIYAGNSPTTLLGTKQITTNLPASTKSLNWATCVQNPTGINKNLTCYGAYMEALK